MNTVVRSICIVCNSDFESESKSNEKNFPAILSKMWTSFCKSFNVSPSKWQDILDHYSHVYELPFCESQNCRNEIAQLFIFDEKLQSLVQRIDRLKATISTKILSNANKNVHSNPMSTNSENIEIICDENINEQLSLMRCEIASCYEPKVLLPNLSVFNCATKEQPPQFDHNNSKNSNNSSIHEDEDGGSPDEKEKESKWHCIIDLKGQRSWLYEKKWPVYLEGSHKGRWNGKNCRFKCGTCGCVCAKRSNLACHIRQKHIEPHLFVCGVSGCTSSYGRPHDLKLHQISAHSIERPFKCFCGKSYKLRKVLAIHLTRDHGKTMDDLGEKQKEQIKKQKQIPLVPKRGRGRPPKNKKVQIVNIIKNVKGANKSKSPLPQQQQQKQQPTTSTSTNSPKQQQLQQLKQKQQQLQQLKQKQQKIQQLQQKPSLSAQNYFNNGRRKTKLVIVKKKNTQMTLPLKLSSLCPSSASISSTNNNNNKNAISSRPCRELSTNLRRETANYPDFDDDEFMENGTGNQNETETDIDPIAVDTVKTNHLTLNSFGNSIDWINYEDDGTVIKEEEDEEEEEMQDGGPSSSNSVPDKDPLDI